MSYVDGEPDGGGELPSRVGVLLDTAIELTGEHELASVLRRIVEGAAAVTGARYAALAVFDEHGVVTRFVHRGMDEAMVAAIGDLPRGRGLLGATVTAAGPIRLDDLGSDRRSVGFPVGHPPMRSYLGAPIGRGGRHFGNLYLTETSRGAGFDAEDEALVMSLAAFAACAIENSELLALERARADAVASRAQAEQARRARGEVLAATIAAQEAERARVSRDLHDDIGQALTSVLLGLRLIDEPGDGALDDGGRLAGRVEELRGLVADALGRTRRLASDLRPTVLDDVGLEPALSRLAADMAERATVRVDVAVDTSVGRAELAAEVVTVVYRVVQEALTNVARHALAANASVSVTVHGGRLRAVVEDDGVGFDPAAPTGRLGLRGMVERAELVGGSLRVVSSPASGTTLVLEVPVD